MPTTSKVLTAHLSWVTHWFPRRSDPVARRACRSAIQNAKIARWLDGGRYPTSVRIYPKESRP